MKWQRTLWFLVPCAVLLWVASASIKEERMPQLCNDGFGISKEMAQKLASIAFEESKRNNISLTGYNSVFAIIWPEAPKGFVEKRSGLYGVRFSPFRCDERSLDGGGFDVEIDPKTLKVVRSYMSAL